MSTDCASWVQLPLLPPAALPLVASVSGRFSGDPSWEVVVPVPPGVVPPPDYKAARSLDDLDGSYGGSEYGDDSFYDDNGEEGEGGNGGGNADKKTPKFVRVSEEKRLAYLVDTLVFDVGVVPVGAYVKTATGAVVKNPAFEGLQPDVATSLAMYAHFRPAVRMLNKSLLEREKLNPHVHFMDTLDEDVPAGSWSVHYDAAGKSVVLRSLLWPGAIAYHVAGSTTFGYAYFGTGEKNWNLPFMLPTQAATDAAAKKAADAAAKKAAAALGPGLLPSDDPEAEQDHIDDDEYDY